MGQTFANRPRWLRLVVSLLIIASIVAAYQAIFSFSQLRALSAPPGPKSGHPAENAAFRRLRQLDANGFIPPDGPAKAAQQIQTMRAAGPAALAPSAWTSIGPGNIGGRIRSIAIHPTTPTTMWLGSVSGGVWKTTNGGASWQPLADYMANLSISSLLIDPNNVNTLYAGTGESFAYDHNQTGDGIFKTTNGGSTWAQIATTKCTNRADIAFRWCGINRLAIAPDGQTLLAATTKGIERGTAGGATWATQTLLNDTNVQDINFAPNDSTKAIASGEGAAWYSTTGGQSWLSAIFTPALSGAPRIEVAYARSNPAIVYASIDTGQGELWKSVDGGQHYTKVTTQVVGGPGLLNGQGWYDNSIWVDPTNANILVVGGIDLYRSTNGGARFDLIGAPHPDQHIVIEDPRYGTTTKTVFIGNDGGIYKAGDITTVTPTSGWQELNNTLGITQFYGGAGNGAGVISGGTQDNGTLQYDPRRSNPTESWTAMYGGDGGFCAADPSDFNYFYGEYIYLQLHRSSNGGQSAEEISGLYYFWNGTAYEERWKPAPYTITDAKNGTANFIAPLALDPNTPNRLLAGGKSVWRTNDPKAANSDTSGPAWTSIKPPSVDYISAITVAPGNANIIWVGYNNGEIDKTTNGTAASPTWIRVDTNAPGLPQTFVTRLTIDPRNSNVVYAAHGTWDGKTIYRTTNGGASWSLITGSGTTKLPDLPVYSLSIDPVNSKALVAGTELGVFASTDSGATWQVSTGGPANIPVEELFWLDRTLVAVTYGRGLFTQYLPPPHSQYLPIIRNDQTTNPVSVAYPPPPTPGPYPAP